jgi:hypothetical protein
LDAAATSSMEAFEAIDSTKGIPAFSAARASTMLVEILHTVRISIRSHVLVAEPFLIVGLIPTIRRILVIGLEAGNLSRPETWNPQQKSLFRASALELGLLGYWC